MGSTTKQFRLRDIGVEQPLPIQADGTISGELPTKYLKFLNHGDYVRGLVIEPRATMFAGKARFEWPIRVEDGRVLILPDNSDLAGKLTRIRNQLQTDFYTLIMYVRDQPGKQANPLKIYDVRAATRPIPAPSDEQETLDLQVPA